MRETRIPRDFQKTVRFEPKAVLALNASYSWELEMLSDLVQRHTLSVRSNCRVSTFASGPGPSSGTPSS